MADWRDELTRRLEVLRLRPEREAEIVEELSQHLDDRVRELLAEDMTPEAARQAALADLDAPGELARRLAAIEARSPYSLPPPGAPSRGRWASALWQDVRYSIRSLRRTPAFTLTVVAALALTIGPTTAILSVGNWLIWRPVPGVANPDRLAVVWFGEWNTDGSVSPRRVSALNIEDLRDASKTIAAIAGWQEQNASLAVEGIPTRRVDSAHVTANFFEVLGVPPAAGRGFSPEEDLPPYGAPVALISDGLARSAFGGAHEALGQTVVVNGRRLTVIGVTPRGLVGASPFSNVDIWYPSWTYYYVNHFGEASMRARGGRGREGIFYTFIVRLAPVATFDEMQPELDVLVPALAEQYPDDNQAFTTTRARVFPGLGPEELSRTRYEELVRRLLLVGGTLLLLGCANVANVLISRGVRRQHEHAVRVALGASRSRLVHLLLTESCVLAVAGSLVGVGIAVWLKELMKTLLLSGVWAQGIDPHVPLDLRVLGATLAVAGACGLGAGIAPAWIGSTVQPSRDLGRNDLRSSAHRPRLRAGLAAAQFGLSLALVTNALLFVATLRNLAGVDLGFDPRGVSVHFASLDSHGYDSDRALAYSRDLLNRLTSDPAINQASLSMAHAPNWIASLQDPAGATETTIDVRMNLVTEAYFGVLGIPLLRGRTFERAETMTSAESGRAPVILEERLARRLFGEADPIGRQVRLARQAEDLVVIGVAGNARWRGLTRDPGFAMYLPFVFGGGVMTSRPTLLVRSERPVREVAARVQAHASALDPSLPFSVARPLAALVQQELAERRVFAWVLSLLGALGFALAAVGLHGLLAQMVGERTREFGIRIAIGADRANVFGLVLRQALWIAVLGGAVGLALAVLGSRIVESQLFGLSRLEPWVYAASAISLMAVVFAAAVWPARVATRIQPVEALRAE